MDAGKISLTGGVIPGKQGISPSQQEEKIPGESVDLTGKLPDPAVFSHAAVAASLNSVSSSSGISMDALSGLFSANAGPLWTYTFPHDPAPCSSTRGMAMGSDGGLYLGVYKRIVKVDPATGKELWKKDFKNEPSHCPFAEAKDGSLLVMDGYTKRLVALDPATGKERWDYDCSKTGIWDPLPEIGPDGTIYTFHGEKLAVLDPSGREKYKKRIGKYSPTIHGIATTGQVILSSGNEIVVHDSRGKELWRVPDGGNQTHFFPKDQEYVFVSRNEKLTALKRDTGKVLWERTPADMKIQSTTLLGSIGGKLLLCDGMNRSTIVCIDPATGKTQWDNKIDGERYVEIFEDKRLMTVKEKDRFYAIDIDSGKEKWSQQLTASTKFGNQALSPGGTLYVQMDKTIYGIDADTGKTVSQCDGFGAPGILIPGKDGKTIYAQDNGTYNVMAIDTRSIDEKATGAAREIQDDTRNAAASKPGIEVDDDFVMIDKIRVEKKK